MTTALPERTSGDAPAAYGTRWLLCDGFRRAIEQDGLPGVPGGRYHFREMPALQEFDKTPCCIVTAGEVRDARTGTNLRDDYDYTINVAIVRASARDPDASTERSRQFSAWGERVRRLFAGKRPPFTVSGVCFPDVVRPLETSPKIASLLLEQLDALLIRFTVRTREPRRA